MIVAENEIAVVLPPASGHSDDELVERCRRGEQPAWEALIHKYKKLIFSVPVKYELPPDAAADVFQSVCFELLQEISRLREPRALPKWLMRVASRKCLQWCREQRRFITDEGAADKLAEAADGSIPDDDAVFREVEREQALRCAVQESPSRCQELVRMLFFDQPPKPYRQVAESLGIATGSIGFIRGRCLARLRRKLLELGFS